MKKSGPKKNTQKIIKPILKNPPVSEVFSFFFFKFFELFMTLNSPMIIRQSDFAVKTDPI